MTGSYDPHGVYFYVSDPAWRGTSALPGLIWRAVVTPMVPISTLQITPGGVLGANEETDAQNAWSPVGGDF